MHRSLCVFLLSFIFFTTGAQVSALNGLNDYMSIEKKFSSGAKTFGDAIYITDGWVKGKITFINKAKLNDATFRYNAFDEKLELSYSSAIYELKNDKVLEFEFFDQKTKAKILYKIFTMDSKEESFPVQIYSEGRIVLGSRNRFKVGRGNSGGGTGMQALDPPKETLDLVKTFYILKGERVEKVSQTKKSLLVILNDKRSEVENYMKQNNINTKNEKEFSMVFNYYNSLY